MEVFLFCYAPLQFPTRAIYVPINLMDVGILAETEKIIQKADEKGYILRHYMKCEGGGLESLNEHDDIIDILQKWALCAEHSPNSLWLLFGADYSDDEETKIPEWYNKSFFYYGGFKHRETFGELKNITELDGEKIVIKNAVFYQVLIKKLAE